MSPIVCYLIVTGGTCLLIFFCSTPFYIWVFKHKKRYKGIFAIYKEFRYVAAFEGFYDWPFGGARHFWRQDYERSMREYGTQQFEPDVLIDLWVFRYGCGEEGKDVEKLNKRFRELAARHLLARKYGEYSFLGKPITRADLEAVLADT